VWLAVIALAVFSTAIAYILYFQLIRRIGSTRALMVTYLIPLFAMLWGALVLGETVTRSMAIGCGLILLGTAIALGSTPQKPKDTHANPHLK
jgi:drug/metabolite transporter (DMT)-like permease